MQIVTYTSSFYTVFHSVIYNSVHQIITVINPKNYWKLYLIFTCPKLYGFKTKNCPHYSFCTVCAGADRWWYFLFSYYTFQIIKNISTSGQCSKGVFVEVACTVCYMAVVSAPPLPTAPSTGWCTGRHSIHQPTLTPKEYLWIKNWQQHPSSFLHLSFTVESRKL